MNSGIQAIVEVSYISKWPDASYHLQHLSLHGLADRERRRVTLLLCVLAGHTPEADCLVILGMPYLAITTTSMTPIVHLRLGPSDCYLYIRKPLRHHEVQRVAATHS